ncbi:MAG: DNA alkylation repair protein [Gemmatimonadota bacterium]
MPTTSTASQPLASLSGLRKHLRSLANPARAALVAGYFKTGAGQYGEGDRFLGVTVPQLRATVRAFSGDRIAVATQLLQSPWHEERLLAVILLVRVYEKGSEAERATIYRLYLANAGRINNWDLVDVSAPGIVGAHLLTRNHAVLDRLARSPVLWERRIAIVATQHFIRRGFYDTTMRLAARLAADEQDLIHKAAGWMLREVADRDRPLVTRFLNRYASTLPRTMLRYAIEKFPVRLRRGYMAIPRSVRDTRP